MRILYKKDNEGEKIQMEGTLSDISAGIVRLIDIFTEQAESALTKDDTKEQKKVDSYDDDIKDFQEAWDEFSKLFPKNYQNKKSSKKEVKV